LKGMPPVRFGSFRVFRRPVAGRIFRLTGPVVADGKTF
jgi:hypothetical protein